MSDYTDFVEAIEAVARAWNDPGPHPVYHREWQNRLRVEWPTLAAAVEKLAEYEVERPG